jgi:hypothetical protein
MSRHGKSKSKPRSSKQRTDKLVDDDVVEAPERKVKAAAPKPQKRVVATETAGALPRENTVRQEPAPEPPRAKAQPAPKPLPAKAEIAKPDLPTEPVAASERAAVETAVESFQRSFQATVEVNRLLLDIGRSNFASGFEFARTLAGVRTPIEAARLQLAFFDERMKTLLQQAEELRALSAAHLARANEPIRAQMRRNAIAAWWR